MADGFTNENNDYVTGATSLDGTAYELIVCKHNPPHSIESRLVTAIKRPADETEPLRRLCQVSVWWLGLSKTVW